MGAWTAAAKVESEAGPQPDEIQASAFAPTIAVEILSPGDDPLDVASKVDVYLRGGSALAIVVDTKLRSMTLHDAFETTTFSMDDIVRHSALPDFELQLGLFFAAALDLRA